MNHLFCELCDNMLVTKIEFKAAAEDAVEGSSGDTNLINYCRSCNFSTDYPEKKNPVYHLNYNLELIKREHIVNKFTAKDNTLPKALGIKCPNDTCPSKKSDIRYIKYDDANMKYIYICIDCNNANIEPNIW
jgi:DNA-directed RNA polymerase subunit M/transcription elongation factor TFIIS